MKSRDQVIAELIHAAKVLAAAGALPATDGNLSARLANDEILITRSGIEKRDLSADGFLTIKLSNAHAPGISSEWQLHRELYSQRPKVCSILHTHAPCLTAFAAARKVPRVSLLAETTLTIGELVLVPYTKPGTAAIAEACVKCSVTASVYLLANHGAVAVGSDVSEALHRMERAEFLARTEILADTIGGAVPLSESEVETLLRESAVE